MKCWIESTRVRDELVAEGWKLVAEGKWRTGWYCCQDDTPGVSPYRRGFQIEAPSGMPRRQAQAQASAIMRRPPPPPVGNDGPRYGVCDGYCPSGPHDHPVPSRPCGCMLGDPQHCAAVRGQSGMCSCTCHS